ncbi:formate dehydrogenase accessory sulfurtransferase FdhD [Marinobacter sp. 71-i]|uniref:Sulfur carrier protein FdhD n=1 Tax=Marinobacter iranensis TaxID=2962607 RepID=A0ABT5YCW7_9GAMM|nr:formate dehydrogenase accessory sulfurtransferase FdhD [Marinobacter iranensis]MDF0751515.1 formate dehydrogenase accessory sulfurtransferase FdhD [Marinobacter iranensis]
MRRRSSSPESAAVAATGPDSPKDFPAVRQTAVEVCGGIEGAPGQDLVAEEVPVAMVYNGVSHAVMMASPCDLEDFALGFSLTEGVLDRPDQLFQLDVVMVEDGISIEMHIAGECFARLRKQRRNMTGRTGCGLCGTESLAHAVRAIPRVPIHTVPGDELVQQALRNLRNHQPLQKQTGATHGAAWCDNQGRIELAREDVGRHNALDKLIGARTREFGDTAFDDGFALISSRASFEMVHKSASVGIRCLVAVSAATALAVREAGKAGMTLIGFARPGRHVIYNRGDDQPSEECEDE